MKQLILFVLFHQIIGTSLICASGNDSIRNSNSILYEKVYLHIDRELYAPGDDIWFKSYLVSGINNRLIPGYKNIYIHLISDSGVVVDSKLLLSRDGTAHGDFQLSETISDGNYTIRAFTKYLENFGVESYFHKRIVISGSKNSLEIAAEASEPEPVKIDISFLPEGGNLILNAINHIAFKAIDEKGKGISVKGKVVDETGEEVVSFRSTYKGMGKFIMMPQQGKKYFALVDEFPDYHFQFEPAKPGGVSLNYKPDGNYLLFTLTRNIIINVPQNYILKASHKGIELFYSQITMNEFQHAQRLFKGLFPLGISKITVLDEQNNTVAERLIFVQNKEDKAIRLDLSKTEFKTREKVKINVASLLPPTDTIASNLSVAVVHEDYFSSTGNNQTIESYLLLDSELKGSIESPASCFIDEKEISADEKLDLVMMVNGWRSYYWNDLEQYRGAGLPNWADYGLSIKGNVAKQWGGKPVDDAKVVIGPFSGSFLFEETRTDANGNFGFDRLYLKDRARIMINAETKTGNKRNDILLEPQMKTETFVSVEELKNSCFDINIPMKFYRENYYRQISDKEFFVKSGILLDEIDAIGQKVTGDGHFRLYGEPDISLVVLEDDMERYFNILDYLQGRVAGVDVVGEEVRIRGASRNPLLLVDGIDTDWSDMINIPMGDIDKIEILKSGFGMAVYGSRGGDGIIAVLTKMGKGEWENNWVRTVHGRITPTVTGFQEPREFYWPKYGSENINDARPDNRPTLLWNPEVVVENGEAKIEFFTADNLARYHIFVEGISKTGKICLGTGLFTVSVPRR
ncbi:MAG: TonB-dependent receptor plug domain-containing protein [Draconibacterium sp.]|nr:TonB-dependent receptor plug domain-containing protein [Draconibacterium sp.]